MINMQKHIYFNILMKFVAGNGRVFKGCHRQDLGGRPIGGRPFKFDFDKASSLKAKAILIDQSGSEVFDFCQLQFFGFSEDIEQGILKILHGAVIVVRMKNKGQIPVD